MAKGHGLSLERAPSHNRIPTSESYGLTRQTRRTVVSIPSNIAERARRRTKKEFIQFLYIAKSSLSELDTQLELAKRLEYFSIESWETLNEEMRDIDKMMSELIRHQKKRSRMSQVSQQLSQQLSQLTPYFSFLTFYEAMYGC